jgi:hypothetical protein
VITTVPTEGKIEMSKPTTLDVLSGVSEIAEFLYGVATPSTERRVRHMVSSGDIPAKKVRGRIESRRTWIERTYSEPDHPNGKAEM